MKQATKMVLGAAAIVAVSAGVAGVTAYSMLKPEPNKSVAFNDVFQQNPNTRLAALDATQMQPVDLTQAAENSVHAVVHIKSTQESKTQTVTVRDPFYDFFGDILEMAEAAVSSVRCRLLKEWDSVPGDHLERWIYCNE